MKVTETEFPGVLIIEPKVFRDQRGFFVETFQAERYKTYGVPHFVQDNASRSQYGTLRGLHYQLAPQAQGKLVGVTRGTVWDVIVDIRLGSPTFGRWLATELDEESQRQVYVPPGFAHGFCVLSEEADFYYKCTHPYEPTLERGLAWYDENIAITWPVATPILSPKDQLLPLLKNIAEDQLFVFTP